MATMIKYELKKIFQNRIFIAILAISLVGMIASSAVELSQYRSGTRGEYELSDMKGTKMPEVFVSKDNIDELRARLTEFENNDEIYEKFDPSSEAYANGGRIYRGKYNINIQQQRLRLEKGEITEAEFEKILVESAKEGHVIKKEYLPEYFKLYQPVSRYDSELFNFEHYKQEIEKAEDDYMRAYNTIWAEKAKSMLENGFTVGYDYGWENIFSSLSNGIGVLLAVVIIFGLCNVFTGEYAGNVDALLLSSKSGRRKTVSAKLAASLIYCIVCWAAYILMTVIVSFAFLGAQGANVGDTPNIVRFFSKIPYILLGCVLLGMMTLAISSMLSKQIPSIAASVLVGLLPAGISLLTYIEDVYLRQLVEAMPVSMVFGSYLYTDRFAYLNGAFYDLKLLFAPVALLITLICVPIVYRAYCKHQVKN